MTQINRLVFNDGSAGDHPSSFNISGPPDSSRKNKTWRALCFPDPEISLVVKKFRALVRHICLPPARVSEGEHRWRCWFCHAALTTPWVILVHDKQRVEVSREHLSDWHKGNYSSCVGATQNFWTFSFSNHTWWIEWKRAIIWFLAGSLSVVGLCWLMISAASHQKRKLSISV